MQFLDKTESNLAVKRIKRQIGKSDEPRAIAYYATGKWNEMAHILGSSVVPFTEATLVVQEMVFGDGWEDPRSPQWAAFYPWYALHGGAERLYTYPGFILARGEDDVFIELIAFALELGWDGILSAKPGRNVVRISHDDRFEFYAGFQHRQTAAKLRALSA